MSFATTIQPIRVRGYDVSAPYCTVETIQPDPIVHTNDIDVDQSSLPTRGRLHGICV